MTQRPHDSHAETAAIGAAQPSSARSFVPGSVIAGRYRVDSYLAQGGMGQVYRAHDLELGVPVALKTIHPEIASSPSALRSFKQEVLLARSVSHPNVCRIYDLSRDEETGVIFLTMEFLPGQTLAARIRETGVVDDGERLTLVRQMADALDAAHRAEVVHRDFKSPNVMVVPNDAGDRAVVTDFGLAIAVETESRSDESEHSAAIEGPHPAANEAPPSLASEGSPQVTDRPRPPAIVGTPAYMAPEQVSGGRITPASDLYAFGVVLFEMCTGQLPFRGDTPLDTARAQVTAPPPSPRDFADIDADWESTILRLLSKDPKDRYASAADVILALEGRSHDGTAGEYSLPPERDSFIGRREELAAIAHTIEAGDGTRLLTILAPGGMGKTRLVQRYGWQTVSRWPGGVWFCDLSEARSLDGVSSALATSLQVPLGGRDPVVQLGQALERRGRALVILDNFEQVADSAQDSLGCWMELAPAAVFLVTSRERLQLREEHTYELEPLDPARHGVELLENRAQAHRPGFAIDDSNQPLAEEIVRRLDGVPLAIELAAARLRVMDLEQLRDRLGNRFKLLAGGPKGRQATLQKALEWSWELLQPWEQSAVVQLSAFEGGFTLEAAESVLDLSSHEEEPFVLDVIQSLVDKSWLRTRAESGAPRFYMYAMVHEYAASKLPSRAAHTDADAAVRHGRFFAQFGVTEWTDRTRRFRSSADWAPLDVELDNFLAACNHAVARGDAVTAVRTYAALFVVMERRGPFRTLLRVGREVLALDPEPEDRTRVLTRLVSIAIGCGEVDEAASWAEAALSLWKEKGGWYKGAALAKVAQVQLHQGALKDGILSYEEALSIFKDLGDREREANTLTFLGLAYSRNGRNADDLNCQERALTIHRDLGTRRSEGRTLISLGNLYRSDGRRDESRRCFESALTILREQGDRRNETASLLGLGNLAFDEGRLPASRQHFEAVIRISRELGDRIREGLGLRNLAAVHIEEGRLDEAEERFQAALAIDRENGEPTAEATTLTTLGYVYQEQGRLVEARETYEAALALHRRVGNRSYEATTLHYMGELHAKKGELSEARGACTEAIQIFRDLGERVELSDVLCVLGEIDVREGNSPAAEELLREADEIGEAVGLGPESGPGRKRGRLREAIERGRVEGVE